ncbi:uncharacterized protein LOC113502685 [Trichoplusia ni]|uniref:Uncharacterized protein LOC113502685 n=1 Tax=Trichoplusia ni TaxID=7111 RepID=A0A7E5WJ24_TRINI|nr:uncharacterized protein LOC113502685 [Trichoplusia ni]
MLKRLNIPGLTLKDIPKKIKNFRSSYYQELKRIRNSLNAGDEGKVYIPKVSWFSLADEYLSSIWSERHHKYYRPKDELKLLIRGKDVHFERRKKLKPSVDKTNENSSNEKIEVTQASSSSNTEGPVDELESFGKYIAASLRSMPKEFSIIAKTELQNTLSDVELRIMRQATSSRACDPLGGASTSSFDHNSSGCVSPSSDSCLSSLKIELDN